MWTACLLALTVATSGWWVPRLVWWQMFHWTWHDGPATTLADGDELRFGADLYPGFFSQDCQGGATYTYLLRRHDGTEQASLVRASCSCVQRHFELRGDSGSRHVWVVEGPEVSSARVIATLDRGTGEFRSLLGLPQDWPTPPRKRRRHQEQQFDCESALERRAERPAAPPAWAMPDGGELLLRWVAPP